VLFRNRVPLPRPPRRAMGGPELLKVRQLVDEALAAARRRGDEP
jgi:hypothetical protein